MAETTREPVPRAGWGERYWFGLHLSGAGWDPRALNPASAALTTAAAPSILR